MGFYKVTKLMMTFLILLIALHIKSGNLRKKDWFLVTRNQNAGCYSLSIDHVGRTPYLLATEISGPIYATEAIVNLLPLVIEDAIKVGVTRDERLISCILNI